MRFVIIGGSDAGIAAALRARELDPNVEITVLLEDEYPNFSICGLPFFLSGETPDWKTLAHRTQFDGITVRARHRVTRIDLGAQQVEAHIGENKLVALGYDRLLIATGASSRRPTIEGLELRGVFCLHSMDDSFAMKRHLDETSPKRAVIVGGGYIGLEMADALSHRGMKVSLASRTASVLPTVDPEIGQVIARELREHGVAVHSNVEVHSVRQAGKHLQVSGANGFEADCELVLIAAGVKPNSQLGTDAGLKTGAGGALLTNRKMESGAPAVYVAGDCAETWHRTLQRYTYLPLGTTSHKQGRVAGSNAVGVEQEFAGTLGTQVVKIFDLIVGRTGLRGEEADGAGYVSRTVETVVSDHKAYYPGATELRLRVTGDVRTGKLLGAQIVGRYGAEVAKRLDLFAIAQFHQMSVDAISDLDLSYTPPVSSPWDPVQVAAQVWSQKDIAAAR